MKIFQYLALFILFFVPNLYGLNPYQYNFYSSQNIQSSGFSGNAAAGNNINLTNFYFNGQSPSNPSQVYSGGNLDLNSGNSTFGDVQSSGNINVSSVGITGNMNAGGNLQGGYGNLWGNATLGGNNTSNLTISGTVSSGQTFTPPANLYQIGNYYSSASSYYSSQTPTAGWINQYGQIQVSALQSGLNVVNIGLSNLNGAWGMLVNGPSNSHLVVNVLDSGALSLNNLSYTINGLNPNSVLFNFPNATSLSLNGWNYLSILAMGANINALGGVNGSLAGLNITGNVFVNGGSTGYYAGFPLDQSQFIVTPEPSTYLIMGGVLLIAAFALKQKKSSIISSHKQLHLAVVQPH